MSEGLNNLPNCPIVLSEDLENLVKQLSKIWFQSEIRPRLPIEVSQKWDIVISQWAESEDMPLLIRKRKDNAGSELPHSSGRKIVPVDNSPAQWVFAMAHNGMDINLGIIKEILKKDGIPMSFAPANKEIVKAKYKCVLGTTTELNKKGWKLSHINPVGLKTRKQLIEIPIDKLKDHFIKLMSPSNMFLVPKKWSGLAEFPEMLELLGGSAISTLDATIAGRRSMLNNHPNNRIPGKDYTKYIFNGAQYGKGKIVLAIVRQFLYENGNTTYEKLKSVFPDHLQGSLGVFTKTVNANEIFSKTGKARYYLDENSILHTGDNIAISICSQWGAGINIERFISKAKSIGYDIKEISVK
jgi:hypothetical protein